jgi:hypothetical protein
MLSKEAMTDRDNEALVRKVLSNPDLFPPEFKNWVPRHVESSATIKFQPYQVPDIAKWRGYVPVLTGSVSNPTLGVSSTQLGRYVQIGKTIIGWAEIYVGSSGYTNGSGNVQISLPANFYGGAAIVSLGMIWLRTGGNVDYVGGAFCTGTINVSSLRDGGDVMTFTNPVTVAAGDRFGMVFAYEAA